MREETGLDVEPGRLLYICDRLPSGGTHVVHMTFEVRRIGGVLGAVTAGVDMKHGIVALAFRCRINAGQLTPNDEATDFRWVTRDEVRTLTNEVFAVRVLGAYAVAGLD
jgi:ADP-ribose pyrophosphatase YjhB (NUDIX family)